MTDVYDKGQHAETPAVYGVMSSVYTDDNTAIFSTRVRVEHIGQLLHTSYGQLLHASYYTSIVLHKTCTIIIIQVLIHNILYHLEIGYAGIVVYVRPNTLKFFYNSKTLQNLVKQGRCCM